jgi:hypothetical protein
VPDPILTLFKYVFLALLYLFFFRVLRAVWVEMREPKAAPASFEAEPAVAAAPTTAVPAVGRSGAERLVAVDPPERRGREFPVDGEVTVGRGGGCAILLTEDSFVSQLHARLFRRGEELFVEDLGSTNGTFLNRQRVTSAVPVRRGDLLQFGRTTFEVRR